MTRSSSPSQPVSFGARHLLAVLIATTPVVAACDGDLFNDTSWILNVCPVDEGPSASSCVLDAAPGIFVRTTGEDAASGTRNAPVKTLDRAVKLASANGGPKRVYACAEDFDEVVTLESGIELYGGLACDEGWVWRSDKATRIVPTSAPPRAALVLEKGSGTTRVEDFEIVAPAGVDPGASSIAVLAAETAATLTRCTLRAGNGAPGVAGEAQPDATPGIDGNFASAPGDACAASGGEPIPGGETESPRCADGEMSIGGAGGDSPIDGAGAEGEPGVPGDAAGGEGQPSGTSAWTCLKRGDGAAGLPGEPGAHGAGAGTADLGQLTATGFVGAAGADGKYGQIGRGGGGGGASSGNVCGAGIPGAGGGSGGTGGCGGLPGRGGGAGGSSIALASVDARVVLVGCKLSAATGGQAGAGGPGGLGGPGGTGMPGGGAAGGADAGCKGGDGGDGGPGGAGGGGRGGHSVAIAFIGAEVVQQDTKEIKTASGEAAGGPAGAGSTSVGANGLTTQVLDLTAPDA